MDFELKELISEHLIEFKKSMQEAFQKGVEERNVSSEFEVLPESHIDRSLCEPGAVAYEAFVDGQAVGGAIVTIDVVTKHNHLDFLFVKYGTQSKGVGQKYGTLLNRNIRIQRYGKHAHHILKSVIFISM